MPSISVKNAFNISNPSEWYCTVLHLQKGDTNTLKIKLSHQSSSDSPLYIEFRRVIFYSGWLSWKGADFKIPSEEDYLDFVLSRTRAYDIKQRQELLQPSELGNFRLLTCLGNDETTIHIICNAAWSLNSNGKILAEPFINI